MALMTYMSDERIHESRRCRDKEIDRMLLDIRRRTGEDWIVDTFTTTHKRWFREPEICTEYRLCCNTGHGEVQVLTSLNYSFVHMTNDYRVLALISKEMVLNFINGYLIALDSKERE